MKILPPADEDERRRKGQSARGRKTLLVSAQPGRSGGASFPAAAYLRTAKCHPKDKLRRWILFAVLSHTLVANEALCIQPIGAPAISATMRGWMC